MKRRTLSRSLRRVLACCALPLAVAAAPLDDMRRLVDEGRYERAYELAQANRRLIGDVHFDFLYGLAAINSGHLPEGILALERHLAAVPANDRARLELGRGYYLIGEYARARAEFEFVLRYNPPAGVRANIERYLQAMALRETAISRTGAARAWVEFGGGHDSNVNGGTFRDELQFQFGNVSLVGTPSQGAPDNFYLLAGGANQTMRVSSRLSMFAGIEADTKRDVNLGQYDLTNLGANGGFLLVSGPALVRGTLALGTMWVGGQPYRDTLVLAGEGSFQPGAQWSTVAFGQMAEFRYHGPDSVRNARAFTIGATLTRGFGGVAGTPSIGARVSWTQEDNLQLRPDLGRRVPLLRVFASISPNERWRLAAGATGFWQRFGGIDAAFGTVRSDTTASLDFTASYAITPAWSLRFEYVATNNRSNQDLYDSKRQLFSVRARYQY